MKVRRLRWRYYGRRWLTRRCKDYCAGCLVCESYRYLDQHGRFPTSDEVIAISDAILGNPPVATQGATA